MLKIISEGASAMESRRDISVISAISKTEHEEEEQERDLL